MTTPSRPRDPLEPTSGAFPVADAAPAPAPRGLQRLAVPRPRVLIAGILVVRIFLVALALGRELGAHSGILDAAFGSIALIAVVSVAATIWLAWRLRRSEGVPSGSALLLQAAIDVVVVTTLVTFQTTSEATSVAALYVLLVTVYALLLSVGRGLIVVLLANAAYITVTVHAAGGGFPDSRFWYQVTAIAFVGALIAVLGNRLAEAAREQGALAAALMQARLEADEILGSIQSGVLSVDGDGRLGYINAPGLTILGADPAAFVAGRPVLESLRARSRDLYDAIARGIADGTRVARAEVQVRRSDGGLYPVGLSTTTFNRPGSDRRLVTAIFTDISDLKRLQEFRLRAERLEAVAALSASLAHEIRNPLAAIRSAVEQLARSVDPEDDDDQTLARLVMRESERLNRLLTEFLDFSRVRATKFERLDLTALVQDVARIVGNQPVASGIEIAVSGEPTSLDADSDLINRMVSNLLLNAAQALDGRGRVQVVVGLAGPGERTGSAGEKAIKLVVRDTGPGIPEIVRERLFEPFVTGRPGGTGLGLAIVQRAVSAHRGVIFVDTAAGTGTTFSIFLPATWNREDRA